MKKFICLFTVLALILTLAGPSKIVSAATVKLDKTNIALEPGKSVALKVTGTKAAIKWSSSDNYVATVSSKGKVTAIGVGRATITAAVNKKKYYCTVNVKSNFDAKSAIKSIDGEFHDMGNGVVGILTNNYKYPVSLVATMVYFDDSGKMIGKSSAGNYHFASGKQCALEFTGPYDSNYNNVPYTRYEVSYSIEETTRISNLNDLSYESNIGIDNVMVKVTNNGEQESEFTIVSVVFYSGNNVVGIESNYIDTVSPGSSSYEQFDFPYDSNYNTIPVDNYKVFINGSYN